jgi:hypothetical protein
MLDFTLCSREGVSINSVICLMIAFTDMLAVCVSPVAGPSSSLSLVYSGTAIIGTIPRWLKLKMAISCPWQCFAETLYVF